MVFHSGRNCKKYSRFRQAKAKADLSELCRCGNRHPQTCLSICSRKEFQHITDQETDTCDAETQNRHLQKAAFETFTAHHRVIIIEQRDDSQRCNQHDTQCHHRIRQKYIGQNQDGHRNDVGYSRADGCPQGAFLTVFPRFRRHVFRCRHRECRRNTGYTARKRDEPRVVQRQCEASQRTGKFDQSVIEAQHDRSDIRKRHFAGQQCQRLSVQSFFHCNPGELFTFGTAQIEALRLLFALPNPPHNESRSQYACHPPIDNNPCRIGRDLKARRLLKDIAMSFFIFHQTQ